MIHAVVFSQFVPCKREVGTLSDYTKNLWSKLSVILNVLPILLPFSYSPGLNTFVILP